MQDKTWYSILGLDAEPLFLQDDMLNGIINKFNLTNLFQMKINSNFTNLPY